MKRTVNEMNSGKECLECIYSANGVFKTPCINCKRNCMFESKEDDYFIPTDTIDYLKMLAEVPESIEGKSAIKALKLLSKEAN